MKKTNLIVIRRDLKKEKARRMRRLCAVLLLAILLAGGLFAGNTSKAETEDAAGRYKYYTSVEVLPGDTLWSIADEFISEEYPDKEAYIAEVKEVNHITGGRIRSGTILAVPYYSAEVK